MTNTNAPVDVLRSMDIALAYSTHSDFDGAEREFRDLREARAAVAELIAAASAVLGNTPPAGQPGHVDFADALVMLQAALSRIGGGK